MKIGATNVEDELMVRINIQINQRNYGGALNISEEFVIEQTDFTEMCKILGQFNDLAKKIRTERAKK